MRVMLHGVPPWAPSGYGVQGALLARGLRDAGIDVTISAYGGFIKEGDYWEGFPLLSCGGTSRGVGRIQHNMARSRADVMIIVADLWPLDAREFDGLSIAAWLPVDCAPLGMPDQIQLRAASEICKTFRIVAMSGHGSRMLTAAGYDSVTIPHMAAPEYTTGDRSAWRREHGIGPGAFLVSTIGVNGDYPSRKGFPELLCAWQIFSERHPDARLYMHAVASPGTEGVDLLQIAKSLGLRNSVGFPDQLKRLADLLGPDYMAGMYRASDVFVMPSLGEGFSVPCIEAMACGTPVLASRNSALTDREAEWYCDVQPVWAKLHQAWWAVPLIGDLAACLEQAYHDVRNPDRNREMRRDAKQAAAQYRPGVIIPQWIKLLEGIDAMDIEGPS